MAGHDLFSFNLNPFGTQTVEFPFDVPLFEQSFALPSPAGFTCPTYVIGASSITAVNDFTAITRVLTEGNGPTTISGSIREAAGSTITLHVQGTKGSKHVTADVNVDGAFTASISEISLVGQYRPLAVSAEYLDLRTNRNVAVNPVTIYWPRPALQAGMFGSIRYNPDAVPYGRLVTYAGTGQFAVTLQSLNVEPDATLLYDDIPIATTIELTENDTQVTGELPGFLLNRGGVHTVSFLNSGLNQQPVLVQSVLVNNAVPTLTDIHNQSDGIGASLMIRGSGFTLDTNVKIGGALRSGALISPSELHVPLLRADRESGVHTVVLSNPAPGGGGVQGSYEVAAIIPDIPVLVARHDLIRSQPAGKHDKNHDKEHDEDDERDNGKDRGEDHDEEHDDDRDKNADTVADLITITNAGKNVLRDVTITSVKLLIKGKVVAESGFPKTLPVLQPGGYCSTQGILPPHSSKAGDAAILQVRGTVHGKAFELSNRVTMPAFDH